MSISSLASNSQVLSLVAKEIKPDYSEVYQQTSFSTTVSSTTQNTKIHTYSGGMTALDQLFTFNCPAISYSSSVVVSCVGQTQGSAPRITVNCISQTTGSCVINVYNVGTAVSQSLQLLVQVIDY